MPWIDTHCHLDAAEFDADRDAVRQNAKSLGVETCVIPAVMASHFDEVRLLAHRHADAYALGIHPLYTPQAEDKDLATLDTHLHAHRDDPRLVALGEIGLDGFVPEINTPEAFAKQTHFFEAQLQIAQRHQLPVILHVRRSADGLLKGLRQFPVAGGIAHAFNGSLQQAKMFIEMGFKLGFGGAMTYDRATKLRALATELPLSALVLETDAPDIPPHWIYTTAEDREKGKAQGRNSPAELPRIATELAALRGISLQELAVATSENARQVLPRLQSVP
ncbi:MAG: TatD family hydrolase [Burkholderiales bacterium]|jgi:TatD DNase family protein|nr:TatD family hydrolase [Burkholderiales bacterium]